MPSRFQINNTVDLIQNGSVIAYATEAVYGLGCDPDNTQAIKRILKIKDRDPKQGLIVIASSLRQIEKYLGSLGPEETEAMDKYWPGPVTLILPANENTSALITGGRNTIAVRITDHKDTIELCNALGHGLISTSANRSGQPAIRHDWQVLKQFDDEIDAIYPSKLGKEKRPSRIIDPHKPEALR